MCDSCSHLNAFHVHHKHAKWQVLVEFHRVVWDAQNPSYSVDNDNVMVYVYAKHTVFGLWW